MRPVIQTTASTSEESRGAEPRFSLIIPAYNEHQLLPKLLDSIDVARQAYRGCSSAIEVIVADNSSTDGTAEIARRAGCRVVFVARRCIASARNGGASVADGETFCFVDADSVIHPQTFNVIDDGLTGEVLAGSTGVVPERWSIGLRVTYLLLLGVLRLFRIDSGVVFCRRSDFEEIGGFDEERLFAEDLKFLLALRRLGRTRLPRQKLARLQGAPTTTSTRKFDKHGEWHLLRETLRFAATRPFSAEIVRTRARRYWYDDR